MTNQCVLCGVQAEIETGKGGYDGTHYHCPNCGEYKISGTALQGLKTKREVERAILSHAVFKMQTKNGSSIPELDTRMIEIILEQNPNLPSPIEVAENLIIYVGDSTVNLAGRSLLIDERHLPAKIGAIACDDVMHLTMQLKESGLFTTNSGGPRFQLSFRGWEEYHTLKEKQSISKLAFMAMPFKCERVVKVFEHFKNATAKTGFELRNDCLETPRVGQITDHIRVAIRRSRFVIADLTGGNQGAYWEAGFAEGLGRPVIYSCEKSFFPKVHFDTQGLQTVIWDIDDIDTACGQLKAIIRNTLPAETIMVDK